MVSGFGGVTDESGGLGTNNWGDTITAGGTFVLEVVMTFLLVFVVLLVTSRAAAPGFAGLAIGLVLTVIHVVGIPLDGTSVNPARSIGPALFNGGESLAHVWMFIVAPLIGGALAALAAPFFETATARGEKDPTGADVPGLTLERRQRRTRSGPTSAQDRHPASTSASCTSGVSSVEEGSHAVRPARGERPEHRPADEHGPRPEGQRLEHVRAAAHAPVDVDLDAVAHRLDHLAGAPRATARRRRAAGHRGSTRRRRRRRPTRSHGPPAPTARPWRRRAGR